MFEKLCTARVMKAKGEDREATVASAGFAARIVRVHQFGLRDRANRSGGPEYSYPSRRLLGFSFDDIDRMLDLVTSHLAAD